MGRLQSSDDMPTPLPQRFIRKFHTLRALPAFTLIWLIPTWILLGVCRAFILTLPLKRMAPFYGKDAGVAAWVPLIGTAETLRARQIRVTIAIAARYSPWNANCYPQALTARTLLGLYRVPHAIYFGVRRASGARELSAHAWVAAGPVPVTGGQGFARYRVVRMFVGHDPALGQVIMGAKRIKA